jgi:hypothetical protein
MEVGIMFPFEFVQRSAGVRAELSSLKVRIWEAEAFGFWAEDCTFTTDPTKAQTFDFDLAWQLALGHQRPTDLSFDPVQPSQGIKEQSQLRSPLLTGPHSHRVANLRFI